MEAAGSVPVPEVVESAPPAQLRAYPFTGTILEQLPSDVTVATDDDVRAVQEAARTLVRAEALSRVRSTNPAARSISDVVRVNRVEGLALGAGLRRSLGAGFLFAGRVRYGTANRRGAGALSLAWRQANGASLSVGALDDLVDGIHYALPGSCGAPWKFTREETGYDRFWPVSGHAQLEVTPEKATVTYFNLENKVLHSFSVEPA